MFEKKERINYVLVYVELRGNILKFTLVHVVLVSHWYDEKEHNTYL